MNWKLLRVLFFAIFTAILGQAIVIPLLPGYAHKLGASNLEIGLIFGGFSLSLSLFLPFMGRLSDAMGKKMFITFGLFAYFLASVAFMLSENVNSLILIRFFQGIAAAMIAPVAEAYAGEITPEGKEGLVMGIINVAYGGAFCVGPVIGGITIDTFGINASFIFMGLACFSGFILCAIFLPPGKEEPVSNREQPAPSYKKLLSDKYISGLFQLRFVYFICMGVVWTFVPLIAETRYGLSGVENGVIITVGVIISTVLMTPMGILSDKLGKRIFLGLGGFVTVIAMILFVFILKSWQLYAISIFLGIGNSIYMPAAMAMAVILGREKKSMGAVISLQILAESLGMAIGPILAGGMMDMVDMPVTFGVCAVIMCFATVITWFLTSDFYVLENPS